MPLTLSDTTKTRFTLAGIGLVQGLVYYLSYEFWPDGQTARAFVAASIFLVSGTAIISQLSWSGKDLARLAKLAPLLPFVFACIAFWVWIQIPVDDVPYRSDDVRTPTLIFSAIVSILLITPFVQIAQKTGRRVYPYGDLFRNLWDNLLIVGIAGAIVGAFWSIILLWSELFKLIEVTLFEDVFTDPAFVSMSLTAVGGYGIALGKEWDKLTSTIRNVLLIVLKALMPLLAVIALLFLVSLPFTGLQPLWDTRHASATLLSLISLTVLFFNGAFREGEQEPPYSRWIRHLVEAALVVIPVYAAITFYALYLRIDQYGLTFERFYGVLFAAAGMLFGIGYAVAVFKKGDVWMDSARAVNMRLVWVVVVCTLLVHTPLLDPLRWSARNQYERLASGKADAEEFDYGYLRFQLGSVGYQALERLEGLTDHPQWATIRDRIVATRNAESYAEVRPAPVSLLSTGDILPLDSSTVLPDSVVRLAISRLTQYQADECEDNGDCVMFPANLDADEAEEYVLVLSGERGYQMLVFDRDDEGDWDQVGRLWTFGPNSRLPARGLLLDTLRQFGSSAEPPKYHDLKIGGLVLRLFQ